MPRIYTVFFAAVALSYVTALLPAVDEAAPRAKILMIVDSIDNDQLPFVKLALSPNAKKSMFDVTVERPEFLAKAALDDYASVYAFDVKRFTEDELAALDRYVRDGGGLCLFAGPRVDVEHYNEKLFAKGEGLFPLPLSGTLDLEGERAGVVAEDHPVLGMFRADAKPLLDVVVVTRCLAPAKDWKPAADSPSRVIARSANGNPLVLEQPYGKGRVAAVLLVPARHWTSWHFYPSWVMFLHELQSHLTAGREAG